MGAWWDSGKQKETPTQVKPNPVLSESEKEEKGKGQGQASRVTSSSPEEQRKEAEKIRSELKQIIRRTNRLHGRVKENRVEIQQILERAKIHERILRSISIPQPIRATQQINADEIVRREKLRLIAQQARDTQDQLRAIQKAKTTQSVQKVVSTLRTS
ncbi:MAG: hypothetical protein HYS55_04835 [Candidatus Omnitrophica bacterium]|nr:hypothetical protein [Candidatus Omnitrophota bacterium]